MMSSAERKLVIQRHDPPSTRRKLLAWAVHAYTACGLLLAAWITAILLQGERTPDTYRHGFLLMLVAMVIDATDGTLARWVRIKEAVPGFDGRRLDDLVDFLLYTCLPLLLIERAGLLPVEGRWVLVAALAASAYGFSQVEAKAADGSFRGFPSYWNVIAFYLYALPLTGWWAFAVILGFALLTFVPSRYPYPTQPGRVNRWLLLLSVPWAALVLVGLLTPWDDGVPRGVIAASAVYPVLYLGVAWGMSMRRTASRAA
jgi:phosphatidylcholine synthase